MLVPKKNPNCPFLCLSFSFSLEYSSSRKRGRTAERSSCVPDFFSEPRKQSSATLHMQTCAPNVAYVEQKSPSAHTEIWSTSMSWERGGRGDAYINSFLSIYLVILRSFQNQIFFTVFLFIFWNAEITSIEIISWHNKLYHNVAKWNCTCQNNFCKPE